MAAQKCETLAFQQVLWAFFAVEFLQRRLVVEQVELRRRADHVQEDDVLGPRHVMPGVRGKDVAHRVGCRGILAKQAAEGERPEAHGRALEDGAARDEQIRSAECGMRSMRHS